MGRSRGGLTTKIHLAADQRCRPVAFITSGEMAIAYFVAFAPKGPFPLLNGGDSAALYCFAFFYLFVAGGGAWSLDRLLGPGRARPAHQAQA